SSIYLQKNATSPSDIHTLSLHDALPIWILDNNGERMIDSEAREVIADHFNQTVSTKQVTPLDDADTASPLGEENTEGGDEKKPQDRKSTRLNSSHVSISYAVFCLKKKKE